ncbi:NAD(+) diphosphatase [Sphingomonas quercus]|uniref:NAD(+) diphosphatase n=1 Tax=Sphingomonas quercus TaxID=2842451 RepID=A0ABS6BJK1_9SPHN|nr:NAD(+) diphosphatase [Sphingomonas quercus]MBU3077996.1 NAD(+) diphosphatase [Sphingomonas quercus]
MTRPGFTGSALDRADPIRQDPAALAAARADAGARLLRMDGIDPVVGPDGLLDWGGLDEAPPGAFLALLGLIGGSPRFVALSGIPGGAQRSPLMMELLDAWPPEEAATYAAARSLIDWHARHPFCARCGAETAPIRGGWARSCPRCRTEHFPRVDPVVIMLAEHRGRVLVGRQASWKPGRYSALAGFVEPGESVEEAVARELHEEAGILATDIRYLASQPWPFPSQLMIACVARTANDALTIDRHELDHAMWVDRAGVEAALAKLPGAPFDPPPAYAIAHSLFRMWLDG